MIGSSKPSAYPPEVPGEAGTRRRAKMEAGF